MQLNSEINKSQIQLNEEKEQQTDSKDIRGKILLKTKAEINELEYL